MRALIALLGLLTVTWVEFQAYPGHSYLQGETQLYVPMLERLDTPGFLSRDLVATNPTFAYTIYDEVTLALHQFGRLSFERALAAQQLLFRFAAVVGMFLLVRSANVGMAASVVLSGLINAATLLASPAIFLTNPEPLPGAFALSLILLAIGCLADEKPLLAGFAAGVALVYEPVIAASFWLLILLAMIFERRLRWMLRPTLPILLVFGLLLANLSQLQPGLGSVKTLGSRITPALAELSRMRTPNLWPSVWAGHAIWSYLFLLVLIFWAGERVWLRLNLQIRWLALGMAGAGFLGVLLSAIMLEAFPIDFALQMPPQRLLVFVVVTAIALCGVAAWHAFRASLFKEAVAWSLLVLAITICPQLPQLTLPGRAEPTEPVRQLAAWAERGTWGSSMFLFPDAGRANYPGIFRALSRRALWTDWQTGVMVNYSDDAGREWWTRWQQTMQQPYSPSRMQEFLSLPIDYYVLDPAHRVRGVRIVFENESFIAYDAQDLRNAKTPLH